MQKPLLHRPLLQRSYPDLAGGAIIQAAATPGSDAARRPPDRSLARNAGCVRHKPRRVELSGWASGRGPWSTSRSSKRARPQLGERRCLPLAEMSERHCQPPAAGRQPLWSERRPALLTQPALQLAQRARCAARFRASSRSFRYEPMVTPLTALPIASWHESVFVWSCWPAFFAASEVETACLGLAVARARPSASLTVPHVDALGFVPRWLVVRYRLLFER